MVLHATITRKQREALYLSGAEKIGGMVSDHIGNNKWIIKWNSMDSATIMRELRRKCPLHGQIKRPYLSVYRIIGDTHLEAMR